MQPPHAVLRGREEGVWINDAEIGTGGALSAQCRNVREGGSFSGQNRGGLLGRHVDRVPVAGCRLTRANLSADGYVMDGRGVIILHRVLDIELPVACEIVLLAARA